MDPNEQEIITRRKPELLANIQVTTNLLSKLERECLLSKTDVEVIESRHTKSDKCTQLLDILMTRANNAFEKLAAALDSECQSGAYQILKQVNYMYTDIAVGEIPVVFSKPPLALLGILHNVASPDKCVLLSHDIELTVKRIQTTVKLQLQQISEKSLSSVLSTSSGKTIEVVCQKHYNDFGNPAVRVLAETLEWTDLTKECQDILLKRQLIFQGKEITLLELTKLCSMIAEKDPTCFFKLLEDKFLIQLIRNTTPKILTGNIPTPANLLFVHRMLEPRHRLYRTIVSVTMDKSFQDILMFTGLEYFELSSYVQKYSDGNCNLAGDILSTKQILSRAILLETNTDFQDMCRLAENIPVHLLQCQMEGPQSARHVAKVHWKNTHGSITTILRFVHKDQEQIDENILCEGSRDQANPPKLITGSHGMGKSVMLYKYAQKSLFLNCKLTNRISYTQYIRAREFLREYKELTQTSDVSQKGVFNTIAQISCRTITGIYILKALLATDIPSTDISFRFFFDEIEDLHPVELELIIKVLKTCAGFHKTMIWVSVRPHLLEKLELGLGVLAYKLSPIEIIGQVSILCNHWRIKTRNTASLEKVAKNCLQKLNKKVSDLEADVANLPLLCSLIAEIYEHDAIKSCENADSLQTSRNIHVETTTAIYKTFVNQAIQKRVGENIELKNWIKCFHMEQAVAFLFPSLTGKVSGVLADNLNISYEEMLEIGLLEKSCSSVSSRFIHSTFAKFFTAHAVVKLVELIGSKSATNEHAGASKLVNDNPSSLDTQSQLSNYVNLFFPLLENILSVEQYQIPITSIADIPVPLTIAKHKHFSVCYFLNNFLKVRKNCVAVKKFICEYFSRNKYTNTVDIIYPVILAFTASNFSNLAQFVIKNLKRFLSCEELKVFLESSKLQNLAVVAARCSSESFKCIHESCQIFLTRPIDTHTGKKQLKTRITPILTYLHVSVENGQLETVKYILRTATFSEHEIVSKLANIYDFCLLNSISDSESVIKRKRIIIDLLHQKFGQRVIKKDAAWALLLRPMNLKLLLKFVQIVKHMGYLIPWESVTTKDGSNILHLLASGNYDENITPETYHDALQTLTKIDVGFLFFLLKENHLKWRAVDIAISSLELIPGTWVMLKNAKIDFGYINTATGENLLFKAVVGLRSRKTLETLLKQPNINWKHLNKQNETILHVAASVYNYEAVEMFVAMDASLVAKMDLNGNTPLHKCLMSKQKVNNHISIDSEPNQQRIISHLIENGAKIDAKNNNGITPLDIVLDICLGGLETEEIDKLRCEHTSRRLFQKENLTLALKGLLLNSQVGSVWHPSFVYTFSEALCKKGADYKWTERQTGASLLHLATKRHSYFGVKCLLEKFNDELYKTDFLGRTPLHYSCFTECELPNCKRLREYLKRDLFPKMES